MGKKAPERVGNLKFFTNEFGGIEINAMRVERHRAAMKADFRKRPRQNSCMRCKSVFYAPTDQENPVCSECLRLDAPAVRFDYDGNRMCPRAARQFNKRMLWLAAMFPAVLIAIQFWHWVFA